MKIVIDIPDEQFITLNAKTQKEVISVIDHKLLISAIQNGTPIPKGHGDLIDRDKLIGYIHGTKSIVATLDAPTIIKADK